MSKRRVQARTSPEDLVVSGVQTICSRWPFVASVSDHFAGYFNELGITLVIDPNVRDEDLISLQNELLAYLDKFWAEEKPDFKWMVMFSDGTQTMVPLVLGDGLRTSTEDLRA